MTTIVLIARQKDWEAAQEAGTYQQSTIESTLEEVGFIHCTTPDQTLEVANRKYTAYNDLILIFIDADKVEAPVKFEGARSGRAGIFPHIYGPLNVNAAYKTTLLKKVGGAFVL